MASKIPARDYSLIGDTSRRAREQGLVTAQWYQTEIPRKTLKQLMKRRDGPAIRDTLGWFALLAVTGGLVVALWGSWWVVPVLLVYGVFYGSASDSRWHECGHGTAFKTRWLNDWLYQLACFMIMREPTPWRWSHARHHTDTIIVGRDPEIAAPRPTSLAHHILAFFTLPQTWTTLKSVARHSLGQLSVDEADYIPEMEQPRVYRTARVWLLLHGLIIATAVLLQSWLPVMLAGVLPTLYGGWLSYIFGLTQHAGLAENVLDHRQNSRTVRMNPVFRFIYWNMNYHIEHHMYPMVPYHALPQLHQALKHDMPPVYPSTWAAYREIIPALWRQRTDPDYFVRRPVPATGKTPDAAAPAAA
ncbi:fatty acid desaturase [Natronospirillum operosum]|uniref:Fatty acid desaturase n=1 Tax=Natronospirillum operosum TaxID=2759953 RepID=A0A4Z0WGU0_9GAMM|nr:fatty acid desaturase family protein [Natronospirillum operosum]TGG95177.1 fatty acid desaturase [Natronospirillum operosum]